MVLPRNLASPNDDVFRACKQFGWRTFATSPFNRGWLLDRLLAAAAKEDREKPDTLRRRLADLLLRFSVHCPDVDHVIIGIRKPEWIPLDLASAGKGPLSESEMEWLQQLLAAG